MAALREDVQVAERQVAEAGKEQSEADEAVTKLAEPLVPTTSMPSKNHDIEEADRGLNVATDVRYTCSFKVEAKINVLIEAR